MRPNRRRPIKFARFDLSCGEDDSAGIHLLACRPGRVVRFLGQSHASGAARQAIEEFHSGQIRQHVRIARESISFRPFLHQRFVQAGAIQLPPRKIPCDAKQISSHGTLCAIVIPWIADQQHEYFLGDVFRRRAVAAHVPRKPEDGSLITLVKSAERLLAPLRELPVQVLVNEVRFCHGAGRRIQMGSYSPLRWTPEPIQYLFLRGRRTGWELRDVLRSACEVCSQSWLRQSGFIRSAWPVSGARPREHTAAVAACSYARPLPM